MGDRMSDIALATMSEFGRTAHENGNRGSVHKRCELDRLSQRICDDLDALLQSVGLKTAA